MTKGVPSEKNSGFVRTIMTEDSKNLIWDPLRVGAAILFVNLLALLNYSIIVRGQAFDVQEAALGLGGYLATVAAAFWASSHQKEPAK